MRLSDKIGFGGRHIRRDLPNQDGLTLMEIVVTISIFVIAITIVTAIIIQGYKANLFASEQMDAINNARRGIDIMVKEIREASPAENGAYTIDTAAVHNLIFYSDIDSDELIEKVRYTLNGTDLERGITEPSGFPPQYIGTETTTIISRYVRNNTEPIFYYYGTNYPTDPNPLATPTPVNEVRLIKVYLKVNVDPDKAPDDFILISNSQIRNLKDNL